MVWIIRDELLALFGEVPGGLTDTNRGPQVVLVLGLQGTRKTTTSPKLGRWLVSQGCHPLLVSTDVQRPAAVQQLSVLCEDADLRAHDPANERDPVERARSFRRRSWGSTSCWSTRPDVCTSMMI